VFREAWKCRESGLHFSPSVEPRYGCSEALGDEPAQVAVKDASSGTASEAFGADTRQRADQGLGRRTSQGSLTAVTRTMKRERNFGRATFGELQYAYSRQRMPMLLPQGAASLSQPAPVASGSTDASIDFSPAKNDSTQAAVQVAENSSPGGLRGLVQSALDSK
jgi:hypothetical protein